MTVALDTSALLSLVGLSTLIFGIIQGPEDGWTSSIVLGSFLVSAAALSAFVRWERRSPHPMLPLTFFEDRRFSIGSGVITIAFFVMFGFFFLATQYLQFARGYSPLEAGLALLPLPIMFVLLSPRSAAVAARFGAGRVMAECFRPDQNSGIGSGDGRPRRTGAGNLCRRNIDRVAIDGEADLRPCDAHGDPGADTRGDADRGDIRLSD